MYERPKCKKVKTELLEKRRVTIFVTLDLTMIICQIIKFYFIKFNSKGHYQEN
jgi:hypothetical protein